MPKPTPATLSRLYCLSGNRCAFPDCTTTLYEPVVNVLIGEVCHIEADSPLGPRHNAAQTDARRQGFANLIIMCRNHHKVIDTDLVTWTVERLLELKASRESSAGVVDEPQIEIIQQLLATVVSVEVGQVIGGSVITTINQSGGQVAHQIVNHGAPRRAVLAAKIEELLRLLAEHPPDKFFISAPVSYEEANRLAESLYAALKRANWKTNSAGVAELLNFSPPVPPGLHFVATGWRPAMQALAAWCERVGLATTVQVGKLGPLYWPDTLNILVGPAPEG